MVRTMLSQTQIAQSGGYSDKESAEETEELGRGLDGTKEERSDNTDDINN